MFVEGLGADRSHERMHHRISFLRYNPFGGWCAWTGWRLWKEIHYRKKRIRDEDTSYRS